MEIMRHLVSSFILLLSLAACVQEEASMIPKVWTDEAYTAERPKLASTISSNEDQEWVNSSCPRSLGPSIWSRCIERETAAISRGMPDLSRFDPELRDWIIKSCPSSLGPSITIDCLRRESTAIDNAHFDFDFSALSKADQEWLADTCPLSLGPSIFAACLEREGTALKRLSLQK